MAGISEDRELARPAGKEPTETQSMDFPLHFSDMRIVMVGKTGVGKSSTGNTILGQEVFHVSDSAQSVTKECIKARAEVDGRKVSVVDTPGLFDTDLTETAVINRLVECITLSCPGPHVFLLVLPVGHFTQEDQHTVKRLQCIFGDEAPKYTIILFTWGDLLKNKTIEENLATAENELSQVVKMCGGRYHVFNNENMADRSQVTGLMDKIFKMVSENGGGCYTNEMYENLKGVIQEREEELRFEMQKREEELRCEMQEREEELKKEMQEREEELRNEMQERVEELRSEMKELAKAKNKVTDQLSLKHREMVVKDMKKKKFPQFRKVTEQCKQQ